MPERLRGRAFWALLILLLLSFCGVSAATLIDLRQDAWMQATNGARSLGAALSQEIRRTLRTYDAALMRVGTSLSDPTVKRLDPSTRQIALFEGTFVDAFLAGVFVTDASGNIIWDRDREPSRLPNLADKSFFKAQRDAADVGLFMSEPFMREDNGADHVVALSRRVRTEDGSFNGVVVGLVRLDAFVRILHGSLLAPGDSINLFTREGVLVARVPDKPDAIGRDMSHTVNVAKFMQAESGVFTGVSAMDGVSRIYSFVHMSDVPIILDVGLAEKNVYASWNRRALTIGLVLVLLSGLTLCLAVLIRREFRRRLETERVLRHSEEQYRLLADHSTDLIIRLDADLARRYVSPAAMPMLGYTPDEMIGQLSRSLIHPDDWTEVQRIAANARQSDKGTETAYRLRTKAGDYVWVEGRYSYVPADGGFIVVLRNISKRRQVEEKLAAAHAELTGLANTDSLTGLANRRRFDEQLKSLCSTPGRPPFSLLMMDIDRFKLFNDRYGHPSGDRCLRQVAEAIRAALPGGEALAARIGGEELAVLLPGCDLIEAQRTAERICRAVEALAIAHEGNLPNGGVVTISIGCAERSESCDLFQQVTGEADQMLYEAKRSGRNRACSRLTLAQSDEIDVSQTEALRQEAIERFRALRLGSGSVELDALTARLAKLLQAPIGFISLYASEVEIVGRYNISLATTSRDTSFCRLTVQSAEPIVVPDLKADPRFEQNPFVTCEEGSRFYAAAPLIDPHTGVSIGAISVCDAKPRYAFGAEERTLLTTFAHVVMHGLD
ncbi:hypothetical protein M673_00080 [Aureimonas sp. AU20]|nr:hypothetical protein M673_00080 [Aureimonas sp. AU20]